MALWHCLRGGVREGMMLLTYSTLAPLSNKLSCESGSFHHFCNLHRILQLEVLSLKFPIWPAPPHSAFCSLTVGPLCPPGCSSLPLLPVWMNVSLSPWLSEFHVVCYSGSSGCLLFLNWSLSFFSLSEEEKHFYLCLHLGWNSPFMFSL